MKYKVGDMVYYKLNGTVAIVGRIRYVHPEAKLPYWVTVEGGENIWAKETELRDY